MTNHQLPTNPFIQLPDLMKTILLHEENIEINIAIEKNNQLTADQGDRMMGVIRKIILQTIRPDELVLTIQHDLGLDEVRAKKLALDLLGQRFLPMQWYVGNVESLIRELNGNVDEYIAQSKKNFPEVYSPKPETVPTEIVEPPTPIVAHQTLLRDFDHRLGNLRGRAEILLRLTGLSSQLEEAMSNNKITRADGEKLLQQLDVVSSAINTQDLNRLETQALKRRLTNVLRRLTDVSL